MTEGTHTITVKLVARNGKELGNISKKIIVAVKEEVKNDWEGFKNDWENLFD